MFLCGLLVLGTWCCSMSTFCRDLRELEWLRKASCGMDDLPQLIGLVRELIVSGPPGQWIRHIQMLMSIEHGLFVPKYVSSFLGIDIWS